MVAHVGVGRDEHDWLSRVGLSGLWHPWGAVDDF